MMLMLLLLLLQGALRATDSAAGYFIWKKNQVLKIVLQR
jgi:hypothetical protein